MHKFQILLILVLMSYNAKAVVVAPNSECPDVFMGKISAIVSPLVDSALATHKVVFTNLRTIKGDLGEVVFVDILKNALPVLEVGDEVEVSLRKGLLCNLKEVEHY